VAGAPDLTGQPVAGRDTFILSKANRSGSASSEACFVLFGICLVLPYTYPGAVPSLTLGIVPSGSATSPSSLAPTAPWSIELALLGRAWWPNTDVYLERA
jgi:hypothetical protein